MKTKLMALALLTQLDPTLKFTGWENGGGQLIAGELCELVKALEADIANLGEPYGWQVQGLRDTFKGNHAELDAKAEAARVGGTAYAFPIYTTPQEPAAAGLLKTLIEAREALQFANDSPKGPICDTIWMMHRPEMLFDFLDVAIENATAAPGGAA